MTDYNHSLMCSYSNNYSYNEEELKELESENASLDYIYFPLKVFNSLKSDNVYTIKDLMSKSESELFRISGLGRKGVDSIKEEFNKINKAIDTDYYIGKRKQTKQTNRKDSMTLKTHHIDYKFNEGKIMQEIEQYVDKTYTSHYAQDVTRQATETIIDQGHGTGFCMGNILKYAQRYGKKDGHNKNDLLKVIHYAIIQLSQDHY